ncbi:nucleotidyltransferase domain-containing protein [Brevibacterium oceani]|uniref:nucleotidyltransferase domain-containing protein n=1 Tax=Brevibacterium oceani TaxID=358099 RepID=UPI0015E63049|nr:nucleotidyltransferase domain-containing protein [Brevibacterium oceani]
MPSQLPADAASAVQSYLRAADRLLPGAIIAAAVGGSIALGAYRPGRSDIDIVAVIGEEWRSCPNLVRRLRLLHLFQLPRLALRAARGLGASACCNTAFIWESEVSMPVTRIRPIASHTGEVFDSSGAFDVNPVVWKELVDGGITIRGRELGGWELDPEPAQLRPWVRENLQDYWAPLAEQLHTGSRTLSAGSVEWCLLGPARMHHTLATGEIISKEAAGLYALMTFPNHAPITEVALAKVRHTRLPSAPPVADIPPRSEWRRRTASAMADIIEEA